MRDIEDGQRFAFDGRIFEAEVDGDAMRVHFSGETVNRVVHTFSRPADIVVDLGVEDVRSGRAGVLSATPEHPFFMPAKGEYVEIGDLEEGTVLQSSDGSRLRVVSTRRRLGNFNVEVEDVQNYFVAAPGRFMSPGGRHRP